MTNTNFLVAILHEFSNLFSYQFRMEHSYVKT